MGEWIHEHAELLWWLTAASAVMFVGSLLLAPALAVRIPADYFAGRTRRPGGWEGQHPVLRWAIWAGRNVVGVILMLAGVAMLVLPGQGLLTIVAGMVVMDFPGKYRLERWLISRRRVLGAVNWLREKRGREPLRVGNGATGLGGPPNAGSGGRR